MIDYRPFRNTDPPALAAIWNSQSRTRGVAQPITVAMLEALVLSKPYFDREGLIVAEDEHKPIGFAHAGFGFDDALPELDTELGVVCQVRVAPHAEQEAVAAELLRRAEQYLRGRGAKLIYGGGIFPVAPFYHGLYGGSDLPGVLASDGVMLELFLAHGYREIDRVAVLQRELSSFRAVVDRQQVLARRRFEVEATHDPPAKTWGEACTRGQLNRTRFELRERSTGVACGEAVVWDMEPLASSWCAFGGGPAWKETAAGLIELEVPIHFQRQGLATLLVGETLKQLQQQGITLVEVQTMQHNAAALRLYDKLGFRQIDAGIVLRRE